MKEVTVSEYLDLLRKENVKIANSKREIMSYKSHNEKVSKSEFKKELEESLLPVYLEEFKKEDEKRQKEKKRQRKEERKRKKSYYNSIDVKIGLMDKSKIEGYDKNITIYDKSKHGNFLDPINKDKHFILFKINKSIGFKKNIDYKDIAHFSNLVIKPRKDIHKYSKLVIDEKNEWIL